MAPGFRWATIGGTVFTSLIEITPLTSLNRTDSRHVAPVSTIERGERYDFNQTVFLHVFIWGNLLKNHMVRKLKFT
jgi:hypothetical protein